MRFANDFRLCAIAVPVLAVLSASALSQDFSTKNSSSSSNNHSSTASTSVPPKAIAPAMPNDQGEEYVVGEGDVLGINVWKEADVSQTVTVRPDGKISLPLLGDLKVSGLSPKQIQKLVTERLQALMTDPQVTVTVSEVRSKMVYITGEVGKPGAYSVVGPVNVLQLIARAGGLTQYANRKNIYVLRAGIDPHTRSKFDYKEVVKGHKPEQNVVLRPGDTVVVP